MNYSKTLFSYFKYSLGNSFLGSAYRFRKYLNGKRRIYQEEYQNLKEFGYHVIENYISEENALKFNHEFKESLKKFSSYIAEKDDQRLFGVENCLKGAALLYDDEKLSIISDLVNRDRTQCFFTLGGYLKAGRNGSSGGGWHRDAFLSQFKAMLYLSNVSEDNGPFEIIPQSHKLKHVLGAIAKGRLEHWQNRISDEEVNNVEKVLGLERKAFVAKAGTLILFNSTSIHRGKPIKSGERIALTNYYFPHSRSLSSLRKKFSPMLTKNNSLIE